jgi:hypothetical protein
MTQKESHGVAPRRRLKFDGSLLRLLSDRAICEKIVPLWDVAEHLRNMAPWPDLARFVRTTARQFRFSWAGPDQCGVSLDCAKTPANDWRLPPRNGTRKKIFCPSMWPRSRNPSKFFIERVVVRMTASDFCAAREVISCQPRAIHIRGDASSSHFWAAQRAIVAVRGARAAAAESGRARAHQHVIIRLESRMRRARRSP